MENVEAAAASKKLRLALIIYPEIRDKPTAAQVI